MLSGLDRAAASVALAGALALPACGGDDDPAEENPAEQAPLETKAECPKTPATEAKTGVVFTITAEGGGPASDADVEETIEIICERAQETATELTGIGREGADALRISVAGQDGAARAEKLAQSGILEFYEGDPGQGAPALTNEDIENPSQGPDPATGMPSVSFDFTAEGAKKFEALTTAVAESGGSFTIVFDGEVVSMPSVSEPISAENGATITGDLSLEEARDMASILELGPLPVELTSAGNQPGA